MSQVQTVSIGFAEAEGNAAFIDVRVFGGSNSASTNDKLSAVCIRFFF
jgi:hypothetical protein